MNKQQRLLLIIFAVVAVLLVAAIVVINVTNRNAASPDPSVLPTATLEPAQVEDPLAGMTEEEIAAMAMEEESHDDYVGSFDDAGDLPDITADPSATEEPID